MGNESPRGPHAMRGHRPLHGYFKEARGHDDIRELEQQTKTLRHFGRDSPIHGARASKGKIVARGFHFERVWRFVVAVGIVHLCEHPRECDGGRED